MFRFFYLTAAWLLWLAAVLLSPLFLLKPKLKQPFLKRILCLQNPPFSQRGFWLHAASFGEVRAIRPIVEALPQSEPLNISVATQTGFEEAKKLYPKAQVRFLPFENWLPFWITPQKALIVFDAELWFALFDQARKTGAKTALFNARVPDKSLKTYRRLSWLFWRIFSVVDLVFAQSETDRERLVALGAKTAETLGNIKLLQAPVIQNRFAKPGGLTTVAASTHEGEEGLIFDAWAQSGIGGRLIVVPRHPQRFDAVDGDLQQRCAAKGLNYERLSQKGAIDNADVTLIDAMGLLNEIYAVADIVVLGGAFAPKGGHNPLEPAHFGCRLICGPRHDLQKPLFEALSNVQIVEAEQLTQALAHAPQMEGVRLKTPLDPDRLKRAIDRVVG
ncbi:MAG: glycosyltransferase N-terminal domain-containing protein [Campylobacterales bacterium]